MISAISLMVLGIILDLKTPLMAPLIYTLSYWRRDAFLISFIFFSLFLSYEFSFENVYLLSVKDLSILIATVLLLEEGLEKRTGKLYYFLAFLAFFGLLFIEAVILIAILTLMARFYQDGARKGLKALILPIFLIFVFIIFSSQIHFKGSLAQITVISSAILLASALWLRRENLI
ncbi:MAG: hypothetical protein QXY19_02805 [Archaeoglobaceae archaeon]